MGATFNLIGVLKRRGPDLFWNGLRGESRLIVRAPDFVAPPNIGDFVDQEVECETSDMTNETLTVHSIKLHRALWATFTLSGELLERLRDIQIEWRMVTLEDALVHAIEMCPERYSDD